MHKPIYQKKNLLKRLTHNFSGLGVFGSITQNKVSRVIVVSFLHWRNELYLVGKLPLGFVCENDESQLSWDTAYGQN